MWIYSVCVHASTFIHFFLRIFKKASTVVSLGGIEIFPFLSFHLFFNAKYISLLIFNFITLFESFPEHPSEALSRLFLLTPGQPSMVVQALSWTRAPRPGDTWGLKSNLRCACLAVNPGARLHTPRATSFSNSPNATMRCYLSLLATFFFYNSLIRFLLLTCTP